MLRVPCISLSNKQKNNCHIKKGKFTVDRQKLVIYSTDVITTLIACNAIKDIVLEFIITAEDILEKESTFRISLNEELPEGYTSITLLLT
jgi:hypothetical protein